MKRWNLLLCALLSACGGGVCGDGVIDVPNQDGVNEACDDGNAANGDGCDSDCAIEALSLCGNNLIDAGEACDGANLNNEDCTSQGFNAGTLSCNNCSFNTSSCALVVEVCNNGVDDDSDGLADCADVDCAANPACAAGSPGDCAEPFVAAAPSTQDKDNSNAANISDGSCQLGGGPDIVFSVTPGTSGSLDLLMASDADLGIFVQTTCGDALTEVGCNDNDLAQNGQQELENLTISVTAGVELFVFIGGFEGGSADKSPFTLLIDLQ